MTILDVLAFEQHQHDQRRRVPVVAAGVVQLIQRICNMAVAVVPQQRVLRVDDCTHVSKSPMSTLALHCVWTIRHTIRCSNSAEAASTAASHASLAV
jgi:hypothetical protein